MSRPKPTVLLSYADSKSYKTEQVLQAEAIFAVFYKGAPINLRSLDAGLGKPTPKYKKVSFSNSGHAFNLAEKLNRAFKCADFSVVMMTEGKQINEGDL